LPLKQDGHKRQYKDLHVDIAELISFRTGIDSILSCSGFSALQIACEASSLLSYISYIAEDTTMVSRRPVTLSAYWLRVRSWGSDHFRTRHRRHYNDSTNLHVRDSPDTAARFYPPCIFHSPISRANHRIDHSLSNDGRPWTKLLQNHIRNNVGLLDHAAHFTPNGSRKSCMAPA